MDFKIKEVPEILGAKLIVYSAYTDQRGKIYSTFHSDIENELNLKFVHDKFVANEPNTLRGLHGDNNTSKLVTCVSGKVSQVVLDVRKSSPTYQNSFHIDIDQDSFTSLLVPAGVANAFYSISPAVYHYKLAYEGTYIDYDEQFSYHWQSPAVKKHWGDINPNISVRDKVAKVFLP